jgi:hypothetical protein
MVNSMNKTMQSQGRLQKLLHRAQRRLRQAKQIKALHAAIDETRQGQVLPGLIATLTSFPARIDKAWISIESIIRQTAQPELIYLVLSEEEFPNKNIPPELESQKKNGLEIIWTKENMRSHNKLTPIYLAHPEATIITFDDDIIYDKETITDLTCSINPTGRRIIGSRGWEMLKQGPLDYAPYQTWHPAEPETPSNSCFLTGVGGILYTPGSLPIDLLKNYELAMELCPYADDIWYWALSVISNSRRTCLGKHALNEVKRLIPTPRLSKGNVKRGGNDTQLQKTMDYFGLAKILNNGHD